MPATFILLQHYLGTIEPDMQQRLASYIRQTQGVDGGWPLFFGGELDLSTSVMAYFALKAVGDPARARHMRRARTAILARGGARRASVFARITMGLFGEVECSSGHSPLYREGPSRRTKTNPSHDRRHS